MDSIDILHKQFAMFEDYSGGILGVSALHIETGQLFNYKSDQLFLMCSTYKLPIAIYLLHLVEKHKIDLDELYTLREVDLRPGFAFTLNDFDCRNGFPISIRNLLLMMLRESCNTSTDIILNKIGGPRAVTDYLKQIGIHNMSVDRYTLEIIAASDGIKELPTNLECTLEQYQSLASSVSKEELAIYLATNLTKIFSYRSVAQAINCHVNTLMDYLAYLQEIFLFEELYKFDYSLKKQYANDKKIYCLDTGLAGAVSFRFSEDKGRILENMVFNELRRRKHEIYFNKQKFECDFIIKEELQITAAIQVCYSLQEHSTKEREINGLLEALQTYDLKEGLILTHKEKTIEKIQRDGKNYQIKIQPVWEWLLE